MGRRLLAVVMIVGLHLIGRPAVGGAQTLPVPDADPASSVSRTPQDDPAASRSVPRDGTDAAFLDDALRSGLYVVESAKLAVARSDNEEVQEIAQVLERDHGDLNERLSARILDEGQASGEGAAEPVELDLGRTAMLAQLRQVATPDFDDLWLRQQIEAHEQAIGLFREQAKDEKGKAAARDALTMLESHLEQLHAAASLGVARGP